MAMHSVVGRTSFTPAGRLGHPLQCAAYGRAVAGEKWGVDGFCPNIPWTLSGANGIGKEDQGGCGGSEGRGSGGGVVGTGLPGGSWLQKTPPSGGPGGGGVLESCGRGVTRQAGPGSGDAGVDGFSPGAGAFGTEGADADAEEDAGGITFHGVLHARPGFQGHGVPVALIDEVFRGDDSSLG